MIIRGCSYHLTNILLAYLLNLRGSDIPHNPLFHAYLFVGLESATIFLDASKVNEDTAGYLNSHNIERREYQDIWSFLRRREWGDGKVSAFRCCLLNHRLIARLRSQILISPQTSYAISLMLTHFRYTVAPSYVELMMSVKNDTEISGLRKAYLRDGASFVRGLSCRNSSIAAHVIYHRSGSLRGWRTNLMKDMTSRNGKLHRD